MYVREKFFRKTHFLHFYKFCSFILVVQSYEEVKNMCKKVGSNQIQTAKRVNLVKFLEEKYPEIIVYDEKSKRYLHADYDSCVISEIGFYRFSNGQKGDQIQFLEDFCGKTFQDAVVELYNYCSNTNNSILVDTDKPKIVKNFEIPEATQGKYKNVWAYLVYKRGLTKQIVEKLFEDKKLYQSKEYNNAVFLGDDYAEVVGTTDIKFKHITPGSAPDGYWCSCNKDADTVYVCESAIDALSLMVLMNKYCTDINACYASMGGLKDQAVINLRNKYKNVILAVDNDQRAKEYIDKYPDIPKITPPKITGIKDWNDLLRSSTDTDVIKLSLTNIYYDTDLPY